MLSKFIQNLDMPGIFLYNETHVGYDSKKEFLSDVRTSIRRYLYERYWL